MIDISYWYFFVLALFGAVVANATGAGGGVVFVPAFTLLGISGSSIIATSFAIQCFGMTAGMLAWSKYSKSQIANADSQDAWQRYWQYVLLFSLPSLVGLLLGQYGLKSNSADDVRVLFKLFSLGFGLSILVTTWFIVKKPRIVNEPLPLTNNVIVIFLVVGFVGGVITAWLSIGVGELVAVTLILMRFPVRLAVGVAVSVSAISVWVGIQKYIWLEPNINLQLLMFSAPAAVIGGTLAKKVATLFSPVQLKIFIAIWILISAVAM